ncbi:MAG: sodium:solute symporter family transporter, partial [Limisphaerales bacterium]
IVTLDLYKKLVNPDATEKQQVLIGRWSGVIVLLASVWIAIGFTQSNETLFENIQTVFFFIAPPFAVIFTLGILWKRANSTAAVSTIIAGFIFSWVLKHFVLLGQYNTFNHRAICAWMVCMAVMITVSLLTPPPPEEKTKGIIWNKSFLQLPPEERAKYRGLKDWRLWWILFIAIVLSIYGFFIYYRLRHPW